MLAQLSKRTTFYLSKYKLLIVLMLLFGFRLNAYCVPLASDFSIFSSHSWRNCKNEIKFEPVTLGERGDALIEQIRSSATVNIRKYIPSPHSELLMGILVGTNDLNRVPRFNDVVRSAGTIHVIVVSGYSISLVFGLVIQLIGSHYRTRNLIIALMTTLIYALISGFDPPVIRAWIMGFIAASSSFYGRRLNPLESLLFSALLILAFDPKYIFNLSFQLSFLATSGIIVYSDIIASVIKSKAFIIQDLIATLSAQIVVWPLISYTFEQVSLVSPLANTFILWTVPISTMLGGVFLLATYISEPLSYILAYSLIPFLDIFIQACYFFDSFTYSSITFKPSDNFMYLYFSFVFVFPFFHFRYLAPNNNENKFSHYITKHVIK